MGISVGNKLDDILSSITGSNFAKNVRITVNELNQNMADLAQKNKIRKVPFLGKDLASQSIGKKGYRAALSDAVNDIIDGVDDATAEKLKAFYGKGNLTADELKAGFTKIMGKDKADDIASKIDLASQLNDIANSTVSGSTEDIQSVIGKLNYYANAVPSYFNTADKAVKRDRIIAAAGLYTGVNVGGRVIRGGSITRDEYGQRDIAGIPFI